MYLGIYPCGKSYIFLLLDEQRERKWEKHVFFAWAIRIFKFRLNNSLPKISQNDIKKFEKKNQKENSSKNELVRPRIRDSKHSWFFAPLVCMLCHQCNATRYEHVKIAITPNARFRMRKSPFAQKMSTRPVRKVDRMKRKIAMGKVQHHT